jgi:hypothetical protein
VSRSHKLGVRLGGMIYSFLSAVMG